MEQRRLGQTYLRQWRQHRGETLVGAGAKLGLSHGQLSRIERGKQPYSQDLLEGAAELYGCEPADLLVRDPSEAVDIRAIWAAAPEDERLQIVRVAEALVTSNHSEP